MDNKVPKVYPPKKKTILKEPSGSFVLERLKKKVTKEQETLKKPIKENKNKKNHPRRKKRTRIIQLHKRRRISQRRFMERRE